MGFMEFQDLGRVGLEDWRLAGLGDGGIGGLGDGRFSELVLRRGLGIEGLEIRG